MSPTHETRAPAAGRGRQAAHAAAAWHPRRWPARTAAVLLAGLLAAGCETQVRRFEGGPWVPFPEGGTLTLKRPIPVARDRARTVFHDGRLRPTGANIGPNCALEVSRISRDAEQTVAPGTYRILRIQNTWQQVATRSAEPRLIPASSPDGGGNPMVQEGFHLWLAGPDPNVRRLTCLGRYADIVEARPPTLAEIRTALGGLATLDLAGTGPAAGEAGAAEG